jgi:hypothetical protein
MHCCISAAFIIVFVQLLVSSVQMQYVVFLVCLIVFLQQPKSSDLMICGVRLPHSENFEGM